MNFQSGIVLFAFLAGCSVPGVGTITIKNQSRFPIAAEFTMSKSDGNKKGRVVTPANDDKNHDFNFKHDPLDETTDNGKQKVDFYLDGRFFTQELDYPAHDIAEIRYQGGEIDAIVEVDPDALAEAGVADIPFFFNNVDERLVIFSNDDGTSSIFISVSKDIETLSFGFPAEEDEEWDYEEMDSVDEVYLNTKSGHNVVEKTYICKLDKCSAD